MWQHPYGMYGGIPPIYPPISPPMSYVPCPPDSVDKVVKIMKHLDKRKMREERKKDEEDKKKKEKSAPKPIMFTLPQVILFVILFGVPVGMANLWWLSILKETLLQMK